MMKYYFKANTGSYPGFDCKNDAGCNPTYGLYCNLTGANTNIWNWNLVYEGNCYCKVRVLNNYF